MASKKRKGKAKPKKAPARKRSSSSSTSAASAKKRKTTGSKRKSSSSSSSSCGSCTKPPKKTPSSRKKSRKSPTPPPSPRPKNDTKDLGKVIKSPLDTHDYKVVQILSNGLEGLLISTCEHELDFGPLKKNRSKEGKAGCIFDSIVQFNKKYADFDTKPGKECKEQAHKQFTNASDKQKQATKERRDKKGGRRTPMAKCRRGVPDPENDMQDARNNVCSVVLIVKTGMFHDPADVPGLAHFCEHAVFLGSKKYPETEGFQKFVEGNGGYSNARTDPETTTYMFNINQAQIETALDMFVDMIESPNFENQAIAKEMDLLTSEFEIKRLNEDHRYLALLQHCAVDDHPASNFGMGTKETLSKAGNIAERLREWKRQHYIAENMLFALQGPYPVEQLEQMSVRHFSKLSKSNAGCIANPRSTLENFIGKPTFDMKKWNKLYFVVPVIDSRFLYLSWVLDPKFGNNYDTKPIHYFMYIMDHRGPGSLDWFLRKKGWILSLCLTCPNFGFMTTQLHTIFSLTLELTEEGLKERANILRAIFSFIHLIQRNKASRLLFDEIRQIHSDIFHYRSDKNLVDPTAGYFFDPDTCLDCLRELVEVLSFLTKPKEELLLARFLLRNYNAQLLDEFVDSLQPDNLMVVFGSKDFAKENNKTLKMYKINYYDMPFCGKVTADLRVIPPLDEFTFPVENPFTQVSMCFPENASDKIEYKSNLKIYRTPKGQVVYGNEECKKGLLPSAEYTFYIFSPIIEDESELRVVPFMDVFRRMLNYALEIELAHALNSLVSFDVYTLSSMIIVELRGPSPKLPQLADIILRTVENFEIFTSSDDGTLFNDVQNSQCELYIGEASDSEACAERLRKYLVLHESPFVTDFAIFLTKSDYPDFLSFILEFKSRMSLVADLDGCVSRSQASDIAKIVDSMKYKPYCRTLEDLVVNRVMELPVGERCLHVSAKLNENKTVFVSNYYQLGLLDSVERVAAQLIMVAIEDTLFEELRTKKHLGYFVDGGLEELHGIHGVTICVHGQADKHSCGYINEEIDAFMETLYEKCLSRPENFRKHLAPYLQKGEKLSCAQAQAFFRDHFLATGDNFRKLSIQIQGYKSTSKAQPVAAQQIEEKTEKYASGRKLTSKGEISRINDFIELDLKGVTEENGYFITNVFMFKYCLPFYGNAQSYDVFAMDLNDHND